MSGKAGRNDPCPCGSGKKYKACCWNKDLPVARKPLKGRVVAGANNLMGRVLSAALTQPKEKEVNTPTEESSS